MRGALLACAALPVPLAPLAAADGDLDTSYDGGAFTLAWVSGDARANVVLPIANGQLLVGGTVGEPGGNDGWGVAKLDANGTRELVWSLVFEIVYASDETMATNRELLAMGRDASDRTILAGAINAGIGFEIPMLARLGTNGGLDDTFDENGILPIDDMPAAWNEIHTRAAAVLPDGRTVLAGDCNHCPTDGEKWIWVTRRLADGSPDTGFSGDGWHSLRYTADGPSYVEALVVDEAGRITIGGRVGLPGEDASYLARLVASSAFDGSFGGGDGIAGPFPDLLFNDLALDPSSGRIAAAGGESYSHGQLNVFTAAGLPDTTFSGDGHVDLDLEEGTGIEGVAFQSDGKLVAVGGIDANGTNNGGFFLARRLVNGNADPSFDGNGVKRIEFDAAPNVRDEALAVTTMGGRLVAVGYAGAGGGHDAEMAVVRTENAGIFLDGFERGTTGAWSGF